MARVPVIHRSLSLGVLLFSTLTGFQAPAVDATSDPRFEQARALIADYCIDCHQGDSPSGDLSLQPVTKQLSELLLENNHDSVDTAALEKMVKRLRARQMPPVDAERPDEKTYQTSLAALESMLDKAASAHPQPGKTDSVRRLNRIEYGNAIRDLLAIDVDVQSLFPADEAGHGFDNVNLGELPPLLLSRYITAAEQISRLAVGSPVAIPTGINVRVPADQTQDSHVEGLPLGTRGGTMFDYQFPVSGTYQIQVRLTRDRDEHLEGLRGPTDIDVLIDGRPTHRFTIKPAGGKNVDGYEGGDLQVDANLVYRFTIDAGPHRVGVTFPQTSNSLVEMKRQPFDASFNRHRHPRRSPALFEASIVGPLDAEKQTVAPEPADTPSRRLLFTHRPNDRADAKPCAEQIIQRIARIAYRRPLTDEDIVVPIRFFEEAFDSQLDSIVGDEVLSAGQLSNAFDAGIESALAAILVNPHFLFRAEKDALQAAPGTVHPLTDIELASRLSFFLWSSLPDDELLVLAQADELHRPETLRAEVMRMLNDQRSQSLVTNFAAQWLYLRNLESFRPDMRLFPDFDDNLRHAFRRETELLFESVLRDDISVLELIRSDSTFLNERLAKHYGVPHVYGSQFRRVAMDDPQSHRGGLLRHASILAVTSYATRTSPTVRGNWILGNILGTPPPPPPPNVPSLKEKTHAEELTIREQLAEHRANPACASCHDLMDPVGFAFENFDAVGRWRNFDAGVSIDASGQLPDGTEVTNFEQLEANILNRPEVFVSTFTEKILTFAVGRGIESYDGPAIRKIVRDSAEQDYRLSSIILGVVSSVPFQMRVVP